MIVKVERVGERYNLKIGQLTIPLMEQEIQQLVDELKLVYLQRLADEHEAANDALDGII